MLEIGVLLSTGDNMIHKNNRVSLKLVESDRVSLANIVSQCPFNNPVKAEDFRVTLLYSKTSIENFVPENKMHNTVITGASIWYDDYYGINSLVITLDAPTLHNRRQEIIKQYNAMPLSENYVPHITLVYNLPPWKRPKYRWWVNQVIDNFEMNYKNKIIRLYGEEIQSTDDKIFTPLSSREGLE